MTKPAKAKADPKQTKVRIRKIREGLAKLYPDAHCALHHANPLELLIATILSAMHRRAR